jgi:magnesium transporter
VRARLYDADARDREIKLEPDMASRVGATQLLWIDVQGRERGDLDAVGSAVGLEPRSLERLADPPERADLTLYPEHIHLVLQVTEPPANDADLGGAQLVRRPVDILAGRDWVLTVHDEPLAAMARFDATTEGETRLGALDAASFVAAVADEVLADYLELVEDIEREIDRLDERALRHGSDADILGQIVRMRRRIGLIRRTLAPHRVAFAALARPDMALHEELGEPWPGLTDRLDRALDAVENLRDLLLGTFEIYMGRTAQDANDTMKVLTLLSAVLLPGVVLAGVMGMNFKLPFFDAADNFWIVIGAMVAFGVAILGVARWRGWL